MLQKKVRRLRRTQLEQKQKRNHKNIDDDSEVSHSRFASRLCI